MSTALLQTAITPATTVGNLIAKCNNFSPNSGYEHSCCLFFFLPKPSIKTDIQETDQKTIEAYKQQLFLAV
jgi:hypothetical protein